MSSSFEASATAHPNIALVKYWGKRDETQVLPHQSSLSVTLAPLSILARVEFGHPKNEVEINGVVAVGSERDRVIHLVERSKLWCSPPVRSQLGGARVATRGDFPKSAGLASSAAAFAALAVALREALKLPRDTREESILARLGSGSACRSIQGGFCLWDRGQREDGNDSFSRQLFPADHWPDLRLVVAVLSRQEKDVGSRDGMRHTVHSSPYYPAWVKDAEAEIPRAIEHIKSRNLEALGELAERNAWRMHATAFAADPPLSYLLPSTLGVILRLREERKRGKPFWFTLDAGPNPVILTDAAHQDEALQLVKELGADQAIACLPGGDAQREA